MPTIHGESNGLAERIDLKHLPDPTSVIAIISPSYGAVPVLPFEKTEPIFTVWLTPDTVSEDSDEGRAEESRFT